MESYYRNGYLKTSSNGQKFSNTIFYYWMDFPQFNFETDDPWYISAHLIAWYLSK